jgi:hypothetical protein
VLLLESTSPLPLPTCVTLEYDSQPLVHNWSLTVAWTLATAGALLLTTLVIELLFLAFLGYLLLPLVPLAGVVVGFPVGALQWLVLRRVVPNAGYWILVTGFAFGLAWLVTIVLGFYVMGGALLIVAGAVGAALIGCAQAVLLRRWSRRARVWVPVSIAGWTAAAAVLLFGPRTVPGLSGPADSLVSWAAGFNTQSALGTALVGGLMAGGISGVALPWILDGKGAKGIP